ncbi:BON domain-containing protein [Miltoncostaea marina]|uniref:BON domain-containing protein n=1 Tax=Miltoncostaea marina TaxID=2843215 RepID=UPI001C3D0CF0|nr:BON domain-containing protein [Miltoncostaea marina]
MEEPPEYLEERVRRRLAEDGRVNALGIEVVVEGRTVRLGGAVATEDRRRAAAEVAEEELPGLTIDNRLTVTELSGPHDAERVG